MMVLSAHLLLHTSSLEVSYFGFAYHNTLQISVAGGGACTFLLVLLFSVLCVNRWSCTCTVHVCKG